MHLFNYLSFLVYFTYDRHGILEYKRAGITSSVKIERLKTVHAMVFLSHQSRSCTFAAMFSGRFETVRKIAKYRSVESTTTGQSTILKAWKNLENTVCRECVQFEHSGIADNFSIHIGARYSKHYTRPKD